MEGCGRGVLRGTGGIDRGGGRGGVAREASRVVARARICARCGTAAAGARDRRGGGVSKDFAVARAVLEGQMPYFRKPLADVDDAEVESGEVEIGVQCNVAVFEWMLAYAAHRHALVSGSRAVTVPPLPPPLEPRTVLAVLVSARFLGMDALVSTCLDYLAANLPRLARVPGLDVRCVAGDADLARDLARRIPVLRLVDVSAVSDLARVLWRLKCDALVNAYEPVAAVVDGSGGGPPLGVGSELRRCAVCGLVYADHLATHLRCTPMALVEGPPAAPLVGWRGALERPRHAQAVDTHFSTAAYVVELRAASLTWREVYWRIWGASHAAACAACGEAFIAADAGGCRYHPEGEIRGRLRGCCGSPVRLLDDCGCRRRRHVAANVSDAGPAGELLAAMFARCAAEVMPGSREADVSVREAVARLAPDVLLEREEGGATRARITAKGKPLQRKDKIKVEDKDKGERMCPATAGSGAGPKKKKGPKVRPSSATTSALAGIRASLVAPAPTMPLSPRERELLKSPYYSAEVRRRLEAGHAYAHAFRVRTAPSPAAVAKAQRVRAYMAAHDVGRKMHPRRAKSKKGPPAKSDVQDLARKNAYRHQDATSTRALLDALERRRLGDEGAGEEDEGDEDEVDKEGEE